MDHPLIRAVRRELKRRGDPAKAPAMQAYMKSAMPYRGVATPIRREIQNDLFSAHPLRDFDEWHEVVMTLWRNAAFREERYIAVGLTGDRRYRSHQTMKAMRVYEEMVVTGAWWDYVDTIASDRLGNLLRIYPKGMKRRMLAWNRSSNLWKRRSSIICQLGFKEDIDLDLLYRCIEATMHEEEFFIRKAIGWALRQHAWTDPGAVVRFVRKHGNRLSNLSKREALKNVEK